MRNPHVPFNINTEKSFIRFPRTPFNVGEVQKQGRNTRFCMEHVHQSTLNGVRGCDVSPEKIGFYSFKTNFCWLFKISTTVFAPESWLLAFLSQNFQNFSALFSQLRVSELTSGDFLKIRVLALPQ